MKFEKFDLNRALAGEPVILRTRQKAFVRYQETNMSVSKPLMGYTATGDALAWTLYGMNNPAPNFGHYDIVGMWNCTLDDPSYTYIHTESDVTPHKTASHVVQAIGVIGVESESFIT